jgi:hypothetical protein
MKILLLLILLAFNQLSFATTVSQHRHHVPTVNAITFWGYLDNPKITNAIEKKCDVKFSHDVYYTNAQFLDTFNKRSQDFDIVITSNMMYDSIKSKIPDIDSDLYTHVKDYDPYFKRYYSNQGYSHNTVFFTFALMGFLYNPAVVNIDDHQSMFDIFHAAGSNIAILTDDSGEIGNLLTTSNQQKNKTISNGVTKLDYDNLKQLTQNTKVYISSDFNKLYDNDKFAFSYLWSGDSFLFIKKSKKPYKFVLPRNSSSICLDLLIQMKDTPEARCVAHALQDQEILKYLQADTFYFTPYFKNNMNDVLYQQLYHQVKSNLSYYKVIPSVKGFNEYYNDGWQGVKLKLDETH